MGSACGLVLAVALTRVLQSQLFGVTRLDPLTSGTALVVLIASAAIRSPSATPQGCYAACGGGLREG